MTHPQAGNLGGGGFMMLRTKDGKTMAIDFRDGAEPGPPAICSSTIRVIRTVKNP
ncbi:hypothetical protein ACVXG7_26920 [Enterobacter hormaechei]